MRLEILRDLNAARAARRPAVLMTHLESGEQRLVGEGDLPAGPMGEALSRQLRSGRSGLVDCEGRRLFLTVQEPAIRLVVIGAVHISQALAPMAGIVGLDLTVVDPRTAFASPERFDGTRLVADWPQDVFAATPPDRYTAVAALSHDPRIDDPSLDAALRADCFYIGALGSRKSHAARLLRLAALGHEPAALERIRAPIGLDIGAVTSAEIAVSIVAEIIAARDRKPSRTTA